MRPIVKGYADTAEGEQIHYRRRKGAGNPVLFFHQTASSGQMYLKTFDRLDLQWDCFAFDTPGFGGSFDPPRDAKPPMSRYADWLREAILDLGIGPAHIVGHHTGACIGVEMAARYPEMALSLTMCGPVPLTAEERLEFSRHFGTPFTPAISGGYLMDNWEYLRALGAAADPALFNREMADMLRAWWGRVQSYNAVWGQDFPAFYRDVRCPMMIMAAPDDVLRPYLARAAEMRPDARVHDIGGANFEPDLDPDGFAAGLNDFLAGVAK
ncbi:alpha/beta hydrolase [Rhizorhabdus wittichii]|uniref:Alpha/beta hydrolase n=1 Tax=Rhizorhabdus wittichii TaxID=160791 RepID=A0A975D014_9SPHN|nr:alpha/beta hydrolase [Rhizorhabdus wittichii]QTH20168.1 alpha/beta hydrolase [Rhizorhabdus wittichii]